ncbi:MAG: hypothetical protein EXQ82_10885 [Pseudolabrys sp.]|nr:hypothetical protein [Pseudolabrys sp.]
MIEILLEAREHFSYLLRPPEIGHSIGPGVANGVDPVWLAVFILLQAGRLWVIASLRSRWTTRVIVMPGAVSVAHGPYRFLRHPNYLIVVAEIAVVPLALGLPVIALVFSIANAALLATRIRVENQALAWALSWAQAEATQAAPPATLANETPRR